MDPVLRDTSSTQLTTMASNTAPHPSSAAYQQVTMATSQPTDQPPNSGARCTNFSCGVLFLIVFFSIFFLFLGIFFSATYNISTGVTLMFIGMLIIIGGFFLFRYIRQRANNTPSVMFSGTTTFLTTGYTGAPQGQTAIVQPPAIHACQYPPQSHTVYTTAPVVVPSSAPPCQPSPGQPRDQDLGPPPSYDELKHNDHSVTTHYFGQV